jgi:hypothetical protein
MKEIQFSTQISASKEHVWKTMIDSESFRTWCAPFMEGSTFTGEWKEGTDLLFYSTNSGGTIVHLDIVSPFDKILQRHIKLLSPKKEDMSESEIGEKWIGTTEQYDFTEKDGYTTLNMTINTDPVFLEMLTAGWPKSLENLKDLCEEKQD